MAIPIGTIAPDFRLYNTERKVVTLGDYSGKILVIQFFPAAFTGVCTQQVCETRDEIHFYNQIGATLVAISVDMPFSLKAFKEKHSLNYQLLSDFNKLTIHEYDMYHSNFILGLKGVAKRGVVVVNKEGVVGYSEETAHLGAQVNFDRLKEELQKMQNS